MLGIWGVRLYAAEIVYAKAVRGKNYDEMETNLKKALALRSGVDNYYVALAQVYLAKAVELSHQTNPDVNAISALMAQAVNAAKQATDISPKSVLILSNLATMYENAAAIIPDARNWAVKILSSAKDLEPSNPILWWRLGNNNLLAGNKEEAVKNYREAVSLKRDYVAAHLGLAVSYEQNGEFDKANDSYQTALSLEPSNVEALFNYGRLLFNRNGKGDRAIAEKVWLQVIQVQPNHSNALYSLGLLYEIRGSKTLALQYYYKVKDLNPGNKDITNKINSLVNGR